MVVATSMYVYLIGTSVALLIGTVLAVFWLGHKQTRHSEVSFGYQSTGSPKRAVEWEDPPSTAEEPPEDQSLKDRLIAWAIPFRKR